MDRLLFDSSPLPMWVLDRQTLAFLAVNKAAIRHYGFSREEFLSMTIRDIALEKNTPPHLLEKAEIPIVAVSNAEPRRYRKKDGAIIDVEVTSHGLSFEGRDAELVLAHDITEKNRSQERLRQSEEMFSKAFQCSPLAITISTIAEGRYEDVNDAFLQLTDYARADVVGHTVDDLRMWVEPKDRILMVQSLNEAKRVRALATQFRTRSGEARFIKVSAELIHLDQVSCVLAITEDVTEVKRLEQQSRQAQKMQTIGRLAGGIAHDFNNILGVIMGCVELIEKNFAFPDLLSKHSSEIKKAAERAASLTRQLLAFSKQQILQPKIIDLNAVVERVSSLISRMIGKDVELVFAPSPDLGSVKADSSQIEQILMNLAVNARDAMPEGGKLVIRTANADLDETYARQHAGARAGAYVMMSVSDTGEGINPDVMPQIFEPFFTTRDQGKGTGLGLATVYGIVKQSGGCIYVYSEPGNGTTFKIYLPQVSGPAAPLESVGPEVTGIPRGSETILLVEDQEQLRELIRGVLEEYGYTVLEAQDTQTALRVVEETDLRIDLVLTDVSMPGKSGRHFIRILKHTRPDIRVLYMSGYAGDPFADALELDAPLLEKPFSNKVLLTKIRQVLES